MEVDSGEERLKALGYKQQLKRGNRPCFMSITQHRQTLELILQNPALQALLDLPTGYPVTEQILNYAPVADGTVLVGMLVG